MKILITESQLKYLVISEQVITNPNQLKTSQPPYSPNTPEQLRYGKAPAAQTDANFPNWLATNFPSVINKYSGYKYPWDVNTINKIRLEDSTSSDPVGRLINVGKKWDAYKDFQKDQAYLKQKGEQIKIIDKQQAQQQAQEKAEVAKREQLYNQMQSAKVAETDRLEKQGLIAKRDVLDPAKVNPSYVQTEFCAKWAYVHPGKPCVTTVEAEKSLEGGDPPAWIDWLITALRWVFPQFRFIESLYDIGMGIYYFVKGINTKDIIDSTLNYLYGILQLIKVLGGQIRILGVDKLTKGAYNILNSKESGAILTNVNQYFRSAPKYMQIIGVILGKMGGGSIIQLLVSVINLIFYPIYEAINYMSPTIGKYFKMGMDFLQKTADIIVQGGKLVNDNPSLRQIFTTK